MKEFDKQFTNITTAMKKLVVEAMRAEHTGIESPLTVDFAKYTLFRGLTTKKRTGAMLRVLMPCMALSRLIQEALSYGIR
jgi:hypothetical protein